MASELQHIVDTIAARIDRPALIEDRRQRVVVYSEQPGDQTDEVRRQSILERHTRPRVIQWFAAAGIRSARKPLRTPPSPELGLLPRVCIPVYHQDVLLGFIWFIDPDASMGDSEIERVTSSLPELSLALYRENFLSELTSHAEARVVRALLLESSSAADAAREAVLDGLIDADGPTSVVVATARQSDDRVPTTSLRSALEDSAVRTRRWIGGNGALILVRGDHAALVITGDADVRAVAEHLSGVLGDALAGSECGLVVGLGGRRPRLARAAESYQEARDAAQLGALIPSMGSVVEWAQVGIYRVLLRMRNDDVAVADVHAGLGRLIAAPESGTLLSTLEVYLDFAGNASRTAETLRLHRSTLYYRLSRIEDIASTDLRDGGERLRLHLAVKLARISVGD